MRRTKIICTLGRATHSMKDIRALVHAGMDVARLNMSHGNHKFHAETIERVRHAAQESCKNVGVLVDLQGPKIRTGTLAESEYIELRDGKSFCLTTREVPGDKRCVSVTYKNLPKDVKPGDTIFMADGLLELRADVVTDTDVQCTVIHGGALGEHKGINLPGVKVSASCLGKKDLRDLQFAIDHDADWIALSFVRTPEDILELRDLIEKNGKNIPVIAKIERPEAVECFDDILEVTNAVMVARGDLGVEVPLDSVPQIQKELIRKCNEAAIPVITATQMLESMTTNPTPTRAEVADVANAIYDGTDAVMLSGETAAGSFPLKALQVMARIATSADNAKSKIQTQAGPRTDRRLGVRFSRKTFAAAISQATFRLAQDVGATRIVCFSKMAVTAAFLAACRPNVPITVITLEPTVRRRCALLWGIDAVTSVDACGTDEMLKVVDEVLLEHKLVEKGDIVVVAAGTPLAVRTRTNMVKLHTIGEEHE